MSDRTVVVIGGTAGIGLEVARLAVGRGDSVVLTGRDQGRADDVAKSLADYAPRGGAANDVHGNGRASGRCRGLALDLAEPASLASSLADVARVDTLVLAAVERDANSVTDYDIGRAVRLVTLKLVGYTEVVHALLPKMPRSADTSVVVFGGRAKDRPYPGSTTVSTVNGGVDGLVRTMALELAPIRVNAIHPGIVGDSPFWLDKPLEKYKSRTPSGELATMADIVDTVDFLARNRSVTAASLYVDCGWEVT